MLVGGQETWHPNPDIFYADGAGPLFDMGPYYITAIVALLGPIQRVAGFASTRTLERTIEIGPRIGERFIATTPTHTTTAMQLGNGVTANLVASFEARGQYICDVAIHGSEGVLAAARPERVRRAGRASSAAAAAGRTCRTPRAAAADARGIGLHDMVEAIAAGRPHRASGRLGAHVVEVARGILRCRRGGAHRRDRVARRPAGAAARRHSRLRGRPGTSGVEALDVPARCRQAVRGPKRTALRSRARAISRARSRGGAVVTSSPSRREDASVTA